MKREFDMKDLGLMKYFLGLEINQNEHGVHVSQKKYAKDLLNQLNIQGCKSVCVLISQSAKLQLNEDVESTNATIYRCLVGKLLYLTHTRPALVHVINLWSRHMAQLMKFQFGAAKDVLMYVTENYDFWIHYNSKVECVLEGYCDSDWSGSTQDKKNTSSFVFNLGSGAICWASKKHETVALSFTEAEYISLGAACCHSIWIEKVLVDCEVSCEAAVQIWCDNKSCIAIAKNPTLHGKTKHMYVKFLHIRELVAKKRVQLNYCSTEVQVADIFTKCLNIQKHKQFRGEMGVCQLQSKRNFVENNWSWGY